VGAAVGAVVAAVVAAAVGAVVAVGVAAAAQALSNRPNVSTTDMTTNNLRIFIFNSFSLDRLLVQYPAVAGKLITLYTERINLG
jgi:hypothetical protein